MTGDPYDQDNLTDTLLVLLGKDEFVRLCEVAGGTRLYIPIGDVRSRSDLWEQLSDAAKAALAGHFGGCYIRVPLARGIRAQVYRSRDGLSHARIAVRLGITETGVDKLFARSRDRSAPANDNRRRRAR